MGESRWVPNCCVQQIYEMLLIKGAPPKLLSRLLEVNPGSSGCSVCHVSARPGTRARYMAMSRVLGCALKSPHTIVATLLPCMKEAEVNHSFTKLNLVARQRQRQRFDSTELHTIHDSCKLSSSCLDDGCLWICPEKQVSNNESPFCDPI